MAPRKPLDVRKRLQAAVDRYHCGPGKYGTRYLLTCLRMQGLCVTQTPAKKRKRR